MSRLDDIIDLIQTTNEVYFITAPGRVRTAYILVDDIVELALKTFLQEKTIERREWCESDLISANIVQSDKHKNALRRFFEEDIDLPELCKKLGQASQANVEIHLNNYRDLHHWSANNPSAFVEFHDVVNLAKQEFPVSAGQPFPTFFSLLDEAIARHKVRNGFYHDHHQTAFTIDDDKCLRALCSLFDLMEHLFPGSPSKDSFLYLVQQNKIVRCQIGVLKLKLATHGSGDLAEPYTKALEQFGKDHKLNYWSQNFEHSVLHTISERFFMVLRTQLKDKIEGLELRISRIESMSDSKKAKCNAEYADKILYVNRLKRQLQDVELLMGV